MRLEKIVLF